MSLSYPTVHIAGTPNDFANTVLMPGDPLRAKFLAENYLTDAKLVNDVRGVQGYTGTYRGTRVSVMASGMGMPSIGIYSYELYHAFGVENIIRIGTAGALQSTVLVRDIVLGMGACTDSNFAKQFRLAGDFAPICSYQLLKTAAALADEMGVRYHVGNLLSSDCFYTDDDDLPASQKGALSYQKMGVLAVEMEAAALYMNAARAGKNALAVCTVSDHLLTGERTTSDERRQSFLRMMELALNIAHRLG